MRLGETALRVLTRRTTPFVVVVLGVVVIGVTAGASAGSNPKATLGGGVEGDGAAQAGYTVSLYASYVTGKPRLELLGTDTTDGGGHFRIDYKLTPADPHHDKTVLYVLAERGESMLAGAVGNVAQDDDVVVNERTTVAIGTAFAQFIDGSRISGNTDGMLNAVHMTANMADPHSGQLGAVLDNPPNGGDTSTRATFNSLADMVAACVAAQSGCTTLFAAATPPGGGPAPTTVLQAIANLTRYPSHDLGELFRLARTNTTYTPALTAPPTSWLLFLKFTGGMYSDYASSNLMGGPGNIAFDEQGFAWVNDNYTPTRPLAVGCAGLRLLKFYPWGEPYPRSPYFGGGLSGAGFGITLDPKGQIWVGNFGFESPACANGRVPANPAKKIPATHDSVSLFRPDGSPKSPSEGFTQGGIWWPQATVSDRAGNIWTANCGNDTVTFIPKGNPKQARNIALPGGVGAAGDLRPGASDGPPVIKPFGLAIDPKGRAWVTGNAADEVYIVSADGTVEPVQTRGLLSHPMGIATDSQGNMWVSSSDAIDVPCGTMPTTRNSDDPSAVLFPADGSAPSKHTGGGLTVPWGNAVDGSDTLWEFNFGRNPLANVHLNTTWRDTGVSRFCGADAGKCPAGVRAGDPISPPTGYTSNALDRVTGGGIDPSGNLWLLNNWKKDGPAPGVYVTNPGGNSIVIVPGAATPVETPVLGPPVSFEDG
jgi:hypothetical protein